MRVDYTPHFKQELDNLFTCNRKYYGIKVLQLLMTSLRKYRGLLVDNPRMGQKEPLLDNLSTEYRSIVLQKNIKLIYFVFEDTVFYADIWDTRQSEEHLKQRIKD